MKELKMIGTYFAVISIIVILVVIIDTVRCLYGNYLAMITAFTFLGLISIGMIKFRKQLIEYFESD